VLAGVPLLLGSLYGSDMLQAALAAAAATAASPNTTISSSSIVLADQHHDLTMERFRALAGGGSVLSQIGLLMASLLPGGIAHAEAVNSNPQHTQQADCSSSSKGEALASAAATPQLPSAFSIAAGRLFHLCLHWWSMALCSQAEWYGQHLHPVFLLPNDAQLQLRLQQHGVEGVPQAAAAAGRLLEAASAGALPAADDLTAVRQFAASLEKVQRNVHSSGSGEVRSEVLLPTRPWWMNLSEKFTGSLMGDSSSSVYSAGDVQQQQQQPQQHHANHTAALAYERAVMAERNAVLTDALWEQAAAAAASTHSPINSSASSSSSSWFSKAVNSVWGSAGTTATAAAAAAPAAVLGVVGVNHLPGIVQEWRRREQQWHAQQQFTTTDPSSSSSSGYASWKYGEVDQQLQQHAAQHLAATDAAAGVLEMFAVGSIGLGYLMAVGKATQPSAAAAAAARSANAAAAAAAAAARWAGQQMPLTGAGKLPYGFAAAGAAGAAPCAVRSAHSATTASSSSSSSSSVGSSWLLGGLSRTALHSSNQVSPLTQSIPANAQLSVAEVSATTHVWRSGASRMRSSHHLARLGLLLLPVGVALLPLQRDAGRLQEASKLLHSIAVVNDEMMSQGQLGGGMASLFELAGALSRGSAVHSV
jgi:hypothetical protein